MASTDSITLTLRRSDVSGHPNRYYLTAATTTSDDEEHLLGLILLSKYTTDPEVIIDETKVTEDTWFRRHASAVKDLAARITGVTSPRTTPRYQIACLLASSLASWAESEIEKARSLNRSHLTRIGRQNFAALTTAPYVHFKDGKESWPKCLADYVRSIQRWSRECEHRLAEEIMIKSVRSLKNNNKFNNLPRLPNPTSEEASIVRNAACAEFWRIGAKMGLDPRQMNPLDETIIDMAVQGQSWADVSRELLQRSKWKPPSYTGVTNPILPTDNALQTVVPDISEVQLVTRIALRTLTRGVPDEDVPETFRDILN